MNTTLDWNKRAILRDALKNQIITIIGSGNIGGALATGLVQSGYEPLNIWVTGKTNTRLTPLHKKLGIHISQNNEIATSKADILILAVKPQLLPEVLKPLSPMIQKNKPLLLSVAAGVSELNIREFAGKQAIIRAMPNTPIIVRAGMTALFANNLVNDRQKKIAQNIFDALGETVWLTDESHIDIVSALSGSGPAYFFTLIEALEEAAISQGLPKDIARKLTIQTAFGSSKMALNTQEEMTTLCKEVSSPGGGTEQAIKVLRNENFKALIEAALQASLKRYEELAS